MDLGTMVRELGTGMLITTEIFVLTLVFSLPLGMVLAFGRMARLKVLSFLTKLYISIMRGTPLMLQLMVVYFGPYYLFGIKIKSNNYRLIAAMIGFVINYAAYFAEIFRGGYQAIDKGQFEAATVLKMSRWQTFRYVIMGQITKIVLPSIGNETINLIKDSSLVYVIGIGDLLRAGNIAASRDVTLVPYLLVGVIYLFLTFILTVAQKRVEKRFAFYR